MKQAIQSNTNVVRTVTTIRSEKDIPEHLKSTLLKIQREEAEKPKEKPKPAAYTPPTPKVEEAKEETPKEPEYDFNKVYVESQIQNMKDYLQWEIEKQSTWVREIERLEKRRSRITQKGGLSAEEAEELDQIDEDIDFCERVLADMQEEYFEDSE